MATVSVTLSRISNRALAGLNPVMPTPDAVPNGSGATTSSAASQQSSVVSPADASGMYWLITASGGDVWVAFGTNPTAAAGTQWLIVDGTTRDWGAGANQKVAIIDA